VRAENRAVRQKTRKHPGWPTKWQSKSPEEADRSQLRHEATIVPPKGRGYIP
jgi:hypothetical protein